MLMTTQGVQRFADVESFIAAVKEIRKTTEDAWVFVDDTVVIRKEIARLVISPVFGKANSKWAVIRSLKENKENGVDISFNIDTDMPKVVFLGMQNKPKKAE